MTDTSLHVANLWALADRHARRAEYWRGVIQTTDKPLYDYTLKAEHHERERDIANAAADALGAERECRNAAARHADRLKAALERARELGKRCIIEGDHRHTNGKDGFRVLWDIGHELAALDQQEKPDV